MSEEVRDYRKEALWHFKKVINDLSVPHGGARAAFIKFTNEGGKAMGALEAVAAVVHGDWLTYATVEPAIVTVPIGRVYEIEWETET